MSETGKKKIPVKLFRADEYLGPALNYGKKDSADREEGIDQLLRDAAKTKLNRARLLELDRFILESEQKLAKLRKAGNPDGDPAESQDKPLNPMLLTWSRELAKLPDDQRRTVIATYSALVGAEKGGTGAAMMPLLLGYSKSNPSATQGDMIKFAEAMGTQFSKGLDLGRSFSPERGTGSDSIKLLKVFKDLITDSVKRPLEEALQRIQPQPGFFEQMIRDPATFSRIKELNLFGHPTGGPTGNTALEIEKLRGERALGLKKLELEWRKAELQRQADDRRTDTILTALTPMTALLAGPVNQKMRSLGKQTTATTPAPPNPTANPAPTSFTAQITCSCGYKGPIQVPIPPPKTLNCPQCGKELAAGASLDTPVTATSSEAPPATDDSPQNLETPDPQWSPHIHPQPAYSRTQK